mmetsp:Transcript_53243/g.155058  ORF Transcript_53243/g.155058 Transcript_53243/m.155058 type:complete len:251 (-) Transcript_53243:109-861(-)
MPLDVVHHGADGHLVEGHGVADEDGRVGRRDDLLADEEAHGVEDVALLAVLVVDEADARVAVGIVLDALNRSPQAALSPAKVDDAVPLRLPPAVHVLVTGLTRGPRGHLDRLVLGPREPPTEREAEGLVALPCGQLFEGRDAGVPEGVVLGLADADAGGGLWLALGPPHHLRPPQQSQCRARRCCKQRQGRPRCWLRNCRPKASGGRGERAGLPSGRVQVPLVNRSAGRGLQEGGPHLPQHGAGAEPERH